MAKWRHQMSDQVYEDYDCMLNQTNIGQNNNKFYIIQVLHNLGNSYYTWNRWGRVGESGMNKLTGPMDVDCAIKDFKKKFQDKTKNKWETKDKFEPVPGKYTLIEMDAGDDDVDAGPSKVTITSADGQKTAKCRLDKPTQDLVKMIFDNDMFKDAMATLNIDVKKMPLGKLSKSQIAKGFEVLEEIEAAVKGNKPVSTLNTLSSKFYTLIPHAFGRTVPPAIKDLETVRQKMDMLLVLGDIELTLSLQKDQDKQSAAKTGDEAPHPLDSQYNLLKCGLEHVKPQAKDYQVINNYLNATKGFNRGTQILDVWKVNRDGEAGRFASHDTIKNRKLLWHGTNVAVVAAILKSGLRIMPHSGGRVGKGIYFASENGKSAGYVGTTSDGIGVMFLNEVALGKEKDLLHDDHTLTSPPNGYDSIVARGRTEPDPKFDTTIKLDGKPITVPQGKPISTKFSGSFSQSEYLVYREDQCRIRYLLKMKF
ncbi:protein mono-ADP-ribosyltransferase PARP3-like isoform X2 [Liolophura sinensis]|uniref:protein mono-ADP-ribosyltransferase PARP3-like isoform X2 n=1 Tax=Liolophura sinensis TaxID=3198878 RepID=UPI0031586117